MKLRTSGFINPPPSPSPVTSSLDSLPGVNPQAVAAAVHADALGHAFKDAWDSHIVRVKSATSADLVWKLEFTCHASLFHWTGTAKTQGIATAKAIADLTDSFPDFNRYKARAVSCVQVAA